MTRAEAAAVLEQLLNGMHPVTGEALPDDHVCVETTVMRALHIACMALMQPQETGTPGCEAFIPASRENTHQSWTDEDDQYILEAWAAGVTVDEMRRKLRRTLRSVKCRLVFLGAAEYAILERKFQPPPGCEHSGLPWYPEEEEAIRSFFAAGILPRNIARQLKRSLRAVALRMMQMKLITEEEKDAILSGAGQEGNMPS